MVVLLLLALTGWSIILLKMLLFVSPVKVFLLKERLKNEVRCLFDPRCPDGLSSPYGRSERFLCHAELRSCLYAERKPSVFPH
nr:MAG TPA: hypothetical protein [Microviridae sp.]